MWAGFLMRRHHLRPNSPHHATGSRNQGIITIKPALCQLFAHTDPPRFLGRDGEWPEGAKMLRRRLKIAAWTKHIAFLGNRTSVQLFDILRTGW
jgi:hypothetical protein